MKPTETTETAVASSTLASKPGKKAPNWLMLTLPVALIAVFAELGYAIINNSVLQVYLVKGLGIDPAIMSMVLLPFFISEVLFKGPLGVAADHWGRKPLMVLGPAVSIITSVLMVMVPYPYGQHAIPMLIVFGLLRLLDGLGAAALWPAMFAYIGDVVDHNKRASAMSLLNVTYIIGLALGFLAGGWVNDTFGPILSGDASLKQQMDAIAHQLRNALHHTPHAATIHAPIGGTMPDVSIVQRAHYYPSFYLASILFALATIIAVIAVQSRAKARAAAAAAAAADAAATGEPVEEAADCHGGKITWESFKEAIRLIPGMLTLAFVAFAGIGCIAPYVKLLSIDEFGMTETDFGLLILIPALFIALAAVPLGWLADKLGKVIAVRFGFILCAVGMWTLVMLYQQPHLTSSVVVIAGTLLGLGFVCSFPAWMALLTTITGESNRGTVIGAVSTAQGLGMTVGLPIGGWLYKHYSPIAHISHISPFVMSAVLLTVSSLLAFVLMKPSMEPKHSKPA
ncbi:MAG TPA: MFS transporter [Capsulimonadaceae bacterium]